MTWLHRSGKVFSVVGDNELDLERVFQYTEKNG